TVTNTGSVAGKEVVELYVSAPGGGLVKPVYELKGFAKTKTLAPGSSETLTVTIDPYSLASFNEAASAWETAAGNYTVHFGASSADIRCAAPFKLARPRLWPVHRVLLPATPVEEITVR
ncbi:MAG: fibronectin type III-like domain-contianing protein, partial [Bacteroidales bacterium]|nr:fibronectin type III-like domain-contianing protein [Bacteroidales bacterium]